MERRKTIALLILILPLVTYGAEGGLNAGTPEELANDLAGMTFESLDSFIRELILDENEGMAKDKNIKPLVYKEYLQRIKSDPDGNVSIQWIQDEELNPKYRHFLFTVYSNSIRWMSNSTLSHLVEAIRQIFANKGDEKSIRIAALSVSDGFFQAARETESISKDQNNDYQKSLMKILEDVSDDPMIRIEALRSIRSLGIRQFDDRIFELLKSEKSLDPRLTCKIISILGEWGYRALLPIAVSILETTSDQKIRNSTENRHFKAIVPPFCTDVDTILPHFWYDYSSFTQPKSCNLPNPA
jgi:hypothetical protein